MDYKNAGVDIEAGYKSVELMKESVKRTMREEVLGGLVVSQVHFPWQRSRTWRNRFCYLVQTDAERK